MIRYLGLKCENVANHIFQIFLSNLSSVLRQYCGNLLLVALDSLTTTAQHTKSSQDSKN
jgi:hypothetical protein